MIEWIIGLSKRHWVHTLRYPRMTGQILLTKVGLYLWYRVHYGYPNVIGQILSAKVGLYLFPRVHYGYPLFV